jgi:hypothetical protein
MSEHASPAVPTSKPRKIRPRPPAKPAGIRRLGDGASAEAKRLAAAILEVLAGMRTPAAAAQVLKLSLPRYYPVGSARIARYAGGVRAPAAGTCQDVGQRFGRLATRV